MPRPSIVTPTSLRDVLDDDDLTKSHAQALCGLYEAHGPLTRRELANETRRSPRMMSRVVDDLEERGLIDRTVAADRRPHLFAVKDGRETGSDSRGHENAARSRDGED